MTTNCHIVNGVHTPSPNSVHFLDKVAVQLLAEGYGTDVENLRHELHQVKRGTETSLRLLEFTRFLKHFELVFSELFRLCKIAVTISVINAAFERSFSTLKIGWWKRSSRPIVVKATAQSFSRQLQSLLLFRYFSTLYESLR